MVERRSPKPKVVGSSPITPAFLWYFLWGRVVSIRDYCSAVVLELASVSWVAWGDVLRISAAVLTVMLLSSLMFFMVDYFFVFIICNLLGFGNV